jgi:dihydrofolate reductase
LLIYPIGGTLAECDPFGIPATSHWTGCCDHRAIIPDENLHRHAVENLAQADALLFGRVIYEMMEAAWRPPAPAGARPDWMEPFARTINAAKKYVVSSTLERVDWNVELVRGDLGKAVQQLRQESGKGLFVAGVKLPLALAELGLIDEYEFMVQPRLAGHGPTFAGLSKPVDLRLVSRLEFASGAVAMRYEPEKIAIGLVSRVGPHQWRNLGGSSGNTPIQPAASAVTLSLRHATRDLTDSPLLCGLRGALQFSQARFDFLDLDGLRPVCQHQVGRPESRRGRRLLIHHDPQYGGYRRARRLLQSRCALSECGAASFPISRVERRLTLDQRLRQPIQFWLRTGGKAKHLILQHDRVLATDTGSSRNCRWISLRITRIRKAH